MHFIRSDSIMSSELQTCWAIDIALLHIDNFWLKCLISGPAIEDEIAWDMWHIVCLLNMLANSAIKQRIQAHFRIA